MRPKPFRLDRRADFYDLRLRARRLNLPMMMAFVLSLIWRQLGSVAEAVPTLKREGYPIIYLAADAEGLGIIKRQRKNRGGATELLYLP